MKGIIYKATNTFNGKVYIGQTVSGLNNRKRQHYRDAKNNATNSFHVALYQFQNGFTWDVIDEFHGDKNFVIHALNVAEEYFILKFNSTDEKYGYNSTKGGYSSNVFAESVRKRAQARYGTIRPVVQYDKDGNFIKEFPSATQAQYETRCDRKTILSYCNQKKAFFPPNSRTSFMWRFKTGDYIPQKIDIIDHKPKKILRTVKKYNDDKSVRYETVEFSENDIYKKKMEHRILQYTLDGKFVKVWDNANKAANSMADSAALIRKSILGIKSKKKPNYMWRLFTKDFPEMIEPYGNEEKIVEMSWDGQIIATYKSTSDAAKKTGCSISYVDNVMAGRIKKPKRKFIKL